MEQRSGAKTGDGPKTLMYFMGPWCAPCREMKFAVAAAAAAARVELKTVNVASQSELAARWKVESVPTLLLIDGDGHVVRSTNTPMTEMQLRVWLFNRDGGVG